MPRMTSLLAILSLAVLVLAFSAIAYAMESFQGSFLREKPTTPQPPPPPAQGVPFWRMPT